MNRSQPDEKGSESRFLYTPGMIADLLSVSVSTIRLLYRRNLLNPVKIVNKLLFFDATELYKARHIASLIQSGFSPAFIGKRMIEFGNIFPVDSFSILQLDVAPNKSDLLLNRDDCFHDYKGQKFFQFKSYISDHEMVETEEANRIDFSEGKGSTERSGSRTEDLSAQRDEICNHLIRSVHSGFQFSEEDQSTIRHYLKLHIISLCELAWKLENTDRWQEAADLYRSALIVGGSDSSISFQLAELLQRQKDYAGARERYYIVLESDRDNIEAWANLGRVFRELGNPESAIAAFRGALSLYPDYLDVHYELGCLLFECENKEEAGEHLRRYLNGAPNGPKTDYAVKLLNTI